MHECARAEKEVFSKLAGYANEQASKAGELE